MNSFKKINQNSEAHGLEVRQIGKYLKLLQFLQKFMDPAPFESYFK